MADMVEKTHKYRNVIDDALDLLLATIAFVYLMWHEQLGITLTAEQIAMAAAFGATARVSLRKILMRLWGHKIPAPSSDSAPADEGEPAAEDTPAADDAPAADDEGADGGA